MRLEDKKVLVVGTGISGIAAAELLVGQKIDTVCGCVCVHIYLFFISSVQSLSRVRLLVTP